MRAVATLTPRMPSRSRRVASRPAGHADLAAWIASRALKPVEGIDDGDIARRVHRLGQLKRGRTPSRTG